MAPFVIWACPGSTWATPGADRRRDKNENFFWSTPNDPIRKVNRLESIFEHLSKISPTRGCSHPSLRKFSRKIWKHDHQKPGRYTVILWWTVDISDVFIIRGRSVKCGGFCICDVSTSLLLVNCECILTVRKTFRLEVYPTLMVSVCPCMQVLRMLCIPQIHHGLKGVVTRAAECLSVIMWCSWNATCPCKVCTGWSISVCRG